MSYLDKAWSGVKNGLSYCGSMLYSVADNLGKFYSYCTSSLAKLWNKFKTFPPVSFSISLLYSIYNKLNQLLSFCSSVSYKIFNKLKQIYDYGTSSVSSIWNTLKTYPPFSYLVIILNPVINFGLKLNYFFSFIGSNIYSHDSQKSPHWNKLTDDGLYLGGALVNTSFLGYGDHYQKIIAQTKNSNKPLSYILSCCEESEVTDNSLPWFNLVKPDFFADKTMEYDFFPLAVKNNNLENDKDPKELQSEKIHEFVNKIGKKLRGGSVYLSSKFGTRDSAVIAICYLMYSKNMSAPEAFKYVYNKRPKISLSVEHLNIIENYRAKYCPNAKKLTLDHPALDDFTGYTWFSYIKSPLILSLAFCAKTASFKFLFPIWQACSSVFNRRNTMAKDQFEEYASTAKQLNNKLNSWEKSAFESGYAASNSWGGFIKSCTNLKTCWNYSAYLAGNFAGRLNAEEILAEVKKPSSPAL